MLIALTMEEARHAAAALRPGTLALVPTMGALHAGHRALMDAARTVADHVAVSIFVNPKQFGAGEDLSRYPRPLQDDLALLRDAGVALAFTPDASALYPEGFATSVVTHGMDHILCGAHRPGHFTGVTTVVALLFSILRPDVALFGEKDYQQLAIIRRMNTDLHLVERIMGVPTVREADGLALSSRNRYLSAGERGIAPALHATLQAVAAGECTLDAAPSRLIDTGFTRVDYLECRDGVTLTPCALDAPDARLFAAAWLGSTRLIDTIAVSKNRSTLEGDQAIQQSPYADEPWGGRR